MSLVHVRAALETHLASMAPPLSTAWENAGFIPVPGTPYQRVHLLPATPENIENTASYTEGGLMQVALCYPLNAGTAAAIARAQMIRDDFWRGRSLVSGGITTTIHLTPVIAPGLTEGDRYVVPVSIPFYAPINA